MLRKNKKWLLIVLIVCSALALLFELLHRSPQVAGYNADEFKRQVVSQKIFLDEATVKMAAKINGNPGNRWDALEKKSRHAHDFLVFNDTTLVGWTSHLLPVSNLRLFHFKKSVVRLANGWYLCASRTKGTVTVVGLKAIKTDYSYQNQYLVNTFAAPFGLNGDIAIIGGKLPGATDIFGPQGDYYFSVVLPQIQVTDKLFGSLSLSFLFLAVIALALLVNTWFRHAASSSQKRWALWGMIPACTLFYLALSTSDVYSSLNCLELFSPVYFAYSSWLSSIGGFVVGTALVAWISYLFYRYYRPKSEEPGCIRFIAGAVLLVMFYWMVNFAVYILTEHSTEVFLFNRIVDLKGMQIFKLTGIFLLFLALALWIDLLLKRYLPKLGTRFASTILGITISLAFAVSWLTKSVLDWQSVLFFAGVNGFVIYYRTKKGFNFSYRHILWLVMFFDIYAIALVFKFNSQKEMANRRFLIETLSNRLSGEQDAIAEMYLADAEKKVAVDPNIRDMVASGSINEEDLRQYLIKNYFIGYLNRYDIQVVPCWPRAELFIEGASQTFDCYKYFDDMVKRYGEPVSGSSHFHFMKKDNGRINYFGVFKFADEKSGSETSLFIEFASKTFFEGLGYPELLVSDKEQSQVELLKEYSYAKYVDGRLAKRSGNYLYQVTSKRLLRQQVKGMDFVRYKNYSHLVYAPKPGTHIVMSYPAIGLSNVLMAFSVVYILFLVMAFGVLFLSRIGYPKAQISYSIRERIQITLVAFSLLLLVAIGTSSVLYAVYQYKSKNYDMLSQRLKSVMMEMEQKIGSESKLSPDMEEYLSYLLQNFSNVFYTDINLYGLDGKLLATSRPELYQKGIMGNYINPDAFKVLSVLGEREYIHNEAIGSLDYISAYVPFLNQRNEVLAYLNLPYFVGHNELREEVSSILVAMINAYLVFILLAIGMAFWASRQITRPLLVLQQRLSKTRLGLKNEKILYNRPDEIGHLVDEYNRMVDELAQSAEKLARSEREMAWREMAKQIAHEIKNPLTPMQLSVQYLQKAWDDKVPDFDKFLRRVTQTLIDHIRQLSVIATEFSHFAKMPAAKVERVDVAEKMVNTVALYEKSADAVFETDLNGLGHAFVTIDAEQLLSVFNNLIKNALQSTMPDVRPHVKVSLNQGAGQVVISVADNGKGIPEEIRSKLFTPNFTTKTSGMGLGLAITKNIVEGAGGKIWFETQLGEGTVFYVSLPVES